MMTSIRDRAYDAIIVLLIVGLAVMVVRDHLMLNRATQRIVAQDPATGGVVIYDQAALERVLYDIRVLRDIDVELDKAWGELRTLNNPKVDQVLASHGVKIKELQARLK